MTGAERHSGDRLAALADGRLPEPDRSRVLDHLVRCGACRADYDAQLAIKGLLRGLDEPGAPLDLRARLSGLAAAGSPGVPDRPPGRPVHLLRRSRRKTHPPRSAGRRASRAGAGVLSFTVLALAGAYALGGAPDGVVVTPPIDHFVREHAAVSGGLPLTEPVLWQLPTGASVAGTPAASRIGSARSRAAPASFGANRGTP
jgi:anti-sigma factor RsiW